MTCSSLETALQARQAQDSLMASQLRAAQHLLQCEKLETQALSQQVSKPSLVCSPDREQKVSQEGRGYKNQRKKDGHKLCVSRPAWKPTTAECTCGFSVSPKQLSPPLAKTCAHTIETGVCFLSLT